MTRNIVPNLSSVVRHLVDGALDNGGATVRVRDLQSAGLTGYVVGMPEFGESFDPGQARAKWGAGADERYPLNVETALWVMLVADKIGPDNTLGSWRDLDGRVYLDVGRVFDDRDEALAFAILHAEIAIFDLARGEEIRVADHA